MILKQKIRRFIESQPLINMMSRGFIALFFGVVGWLKGARGASEHLRSTFSFLRKESCVRGYPVNVTIEPSTYCNLKCPICETGCGELERPRENMSIESFRHIIDQIAPFTNTLMFYFMGEPFFNKDAYTMISYAKSKGIDWINTCTNGDTVEPKKLVESGINEISFQIGGLTQSTHQIYRVGSNLDTIVANMQETLRLRKERGVSIKVVCGFILMKHNEHEVADFLKLMRELGVDEAQIIDPCLRTADQAIIYLPEDKNHWIYDIDALKRGELVHKNKAKKGCPWIYYSVVVCANGDVVPCCRDAQGHFVMGNLLEQSFSDIWNGVRFVEFRKRIIQDQKNVEMCTVCDGYYPARLM